ncbi:MAG: uroporphyrinogen-III synthase [Acidobacteriota bacterium]|nr:uroporphyrinogen-III synthase [Acidobacteriota bacterium]
MSFAGLHVLSLESRRAAEIETLIRKQGGAPFVAPSVRERALDDHSAAFRMLDRLEADSIDMLILMTGVGLAFWREVIAGRYDLARADAALRRVKLLARGPKPGAVLRGAGITPDVTIPEPNTWREIVEVLRLREERRLAVQEYGRPNPQFIEALEALGAAVESFALYRWEMPEDTAPLREAVRRLAKREADVVLFTSSIQLEHLLALAAEQHLAGEVESALREHSAIASIGPIMNEALAEHGLTPDIVPASPKMGQLVYAAAEQSAEVIGKKRGAA